jgi:hypothetical protein
MTPTCLKPVIQLNNNAGDRSIAKLYMKKKAKRVLIIAVLLFLGILYGMQPPASSRDIDLDSIYLSPDTPLLQQLKDLKIDIHRSIQALLIDSNVIFARWMRGNEIVYIKEINDTNIVYIYNRKIHKSRELVRIDGTVTGTLLSRNGRYLFIKQLKKNSSGMPVSMRIFVNTASGQKKIQPSDYPFIDFSLSPEGNSILYHSTQGIVEYFPESGIARTIMPYGKYKKIIRPLGVTIPYLSPNRKKMLVINGTGGDYRAVLIHKKRKKYITGITSATEIYWLDNRSLILRRGSIGNFSVYIYNINSGRQKLIAAHSLNTNICYSPIAKKASVLVNQVIHIFDARTGSLTNFGIEGEDASFSHDGNSFTLLLYKNLFITRINEIKRHELEIRNLAREILAIYKKLLNKPEMWLNEYSPAYLRKKIGIYKKIL